MNPTPPTPQRAGESGYILLGVLILVFLFALALAVAAPIMAKSIERDKEVEAVQRGKQYTRAIRLYYKRFGAYPTSIKQLEETNNIRFLRKRYTDPLTGKDDWRLIHVGEAKVPVMGFFGQPLQGGMSSVSTGVNGNGTSGIGAGGATSGTFGNSGFGSTSSAFGSSGSGFGSTSGSTTSTDPSANGGSTAPVGVLPGMSSAGATPGTAAGANGTGANNASSSGFNNGATIGGGIDGSGAPIVGIGLPTTNTKKSVLVYIKQDAFNKWEFTYDPIMDQMVANSSSIPGASSTGTPIGGGTPGSTNSTTSGFGSASSFGSTSSTFGSGSSGFGSTSGSTPGSSGPTSPTPQN